MGIYKRLIGIVKPSLKKIVGKAKMSYVEMCTIISEVEGNICPNNCPFIYLNDENVSELLTPDHLIYRRSLTSVNENDLVNINENEMRTMKVFTANLLKQFRDKFKYEYSLTLQHRDSYDRNIKRSDCYLKRGDVIIVKEETMPRLSWRKRRVMELHAGDDAIIRSAFVKVYQKNSDKTFILKQTWQHLVLLESTIKEPVNESQCSRREAAWNADTIRKSTT